MPSRSKGHGSLAFPTRWSDWGRTAVVSAILLPLTAAPAAFGQTLFGEIEGRPAPVSHRRCIGGASAGALCNSDAGCPGSTCQQKNIFNVTVAVRFNATAAQLTTIRQQFELGSQLLLDATDGQAQFGQVTILNNSTGARGHFWIPQNGGCVTNTGSWGAVSAGNTSIGFNSLSGANGPSCVAHEFVHQAFDARDEYEARAAGCGAVTGAAQCPDAAQGANSTAQEACLMECCARVGTELCWGQAAGDNLAGGNHDATSVTEQSRCRANRSCWDQVGWSWPQTTLVPAGAPDAGTNGVAHTPVVFLQPPVTARIVLVLDRSGSMTAESPSRIERLRTAALDVVDMAENGVELGIVSFSTTGANDVAIAALPANRAPWTAAVNALAAGGATNVGDGLQRGRDMIIGAGGVTAGSGIILMTDGLNNQPPPDPQADLQARLATLLADGIPVLVTCTGDDLGLDSQCAEIAAGTNGTYVDSADAGELPDRFVTFFERLAGREPVTLAAGDLTEAGHKPYTVLVEKGAGAVTIALLWHNPAAQVEVIATDPKGKIHRTSAIPQGRWLRVAKPVAGEWKVTVRPGGSSASGRFTLRAYAQNAHAALAAWPRRPVEQPGAPLQLCARPMYDGPLSGVNVKGTLQTPTGTRHQLVLLDNGQAANGDDVPDDGTYCALFTGTNARGAYTLEVQAVARGAKALPNHQPGISAKATEPVDFERSAQTSVTVDDSKGDVAHYKLYKIDPRSPFKPRQVKLQDRFGPSVAQVRAPWLLGTPSDKNGEGLRDKSTHLEFYRIEDKPEKPGPSLVDISSQFGTDQARLGRAIALAVPTLKNEEKADPKSDHFKCYEAKVEKPNRPVPATLTDQFERASGRVGDAWLACVQVRKNDEVLAPGRRGDLVCHQWKQGPSAASGKRITAQNQFGKERDIVGMPVGVCTPANVEAVRNR